MSASPQITLWPRGQEQVEIVPANLCFVCEYDAYIFVDHIRVRLYFERTALLDVLYEWTELGARRRRPFTLATVAATAPPAGSEAEAVLRMLGPVWRSQSGSSWPQRYCRGDLVSRAAFHRVRDEMDAERAALAAQAESERGAEIIQVAEALGLHPEPAGVGPHAWYVNCPTGRPHRIPAQSQSNQWGCGYCGIKGGPEELRAEVARRRAP